MYLHEKSYICKSNNIESIKIMGNNTSKTSLFQPKSISQCLDDKGNLSTDLYYMYKRYKSRKQRQEELDSELEGNFLQGFQHNENETEEIDFPKRIRRRSCFKKNLNVFRNENGDIVPINCTNSSWYTTYVSNPLLNDSKFIKKFRRRFRCNYCSYQHLVLLVRNNDLFDRWQRRDAAGREASPIELLVLGVLRYIGRGWTFDDLEENTSIHEETHRQFFRIFIFWGSTALFAEYVLSYKQ